MYYRIKNKLDTEIIGESLKSEKIGRAVMKRVGELAAILDREYGCCRGSSDMGGYILLFTESQTYESYVSRIMECYHLEKDLYEYSQKIGNMENDSAEWQEELYLLSSDDALVLIHPKIQG